MDYLLEAIARRGVAIRVVEQKRATTLSMLSIAQCLYVFERTPADLPADAHVRHESLEV